MQYGIAHEAIFISVHFIVLVQNHGETKGWRIKLWRIGYQLPNPPKFSPANVLYAVRFIISHYSRQAQYYQPPMHLINCYAQMKISLFL